MFNAKYPDTCTFNILIPPDYKKMFYKRIAKFKNNINYNLFSDFYSRSQIFNIYSKNDIFLYPSLRDAWGRVILEAGINGLIPIVLDLGGPAEIGRELNTSIIPINNNNIIENIVDQLEKYYLDFEYLPTESMRIQKTIKEKYNYEQLAIPIKKHYKYILTA